MSIIRVVHNRENPYVQLNKGVLWDPKLSLKAIGLWARCLSRPNDWRFSIKELVSRSKEGRRAIDGAIQELIEHGYVLKIDHWEKGEDGKFFTGGVEYVFFEVPATAGDKEKAIQEFKKRFPRCGFGNSRNSNLLKKECNQKPEEEKKKMLKEKGLPPPFPHRSANRTPPIILKGRSFEGISSDDRKAWREKFPSIHLEKEIDRCAEWALTNRRKDYRKSLLSWFTHCDKAHTTPYSPTPHEEKKEVAQEEIELNKTLASKWEKEFQKISPSNNLHYFLEALHEKITFILPSNRGFSVPYALAAAEFRKKCENGLKALRIPFSDGREGSLTPL